MSTYFDRDGVAISMYRWTELFGDKDYQQVAYDEVGPYSVSTVWLGVDHSFGGDGNPIIFETMIFLKEDAPPGTAHPDGQVRYSTEYEALEGHQKTIQMLVGLIHGVPELGSGPIPISKFSSGGPVTGF